MSQQIETILRFDAAIADTAAQIAECEDNAERHALREHHKKTIMMRNARASMIKRSKGDKIIYFPGRWKR